MAQGEGTTNYRVGELEKGFDKLDTKVDLILSNHLPHINESLISQNVKMNILTAVNIGSLILYAIITKYLK